MSRSQKNHKALPSYQKALQNFGYKHIFIFEGPYNDNNKVVANKIKRVGMDN